MMKDCKICGVSTRYPDGSIHCALEKCVEGDDCKNFYDGMHPHNLLEMIYRLRVRVAQL